MEIIISKDSAKFLMKLGNNKVAKQIVLKLKELQNKPVLSNNKKLKGDLSGYYRLAVCEFRIIYKIKNEQLLIELIGKRNDAEIYKLMNNKVSN